jgi:hypothetical protein
MIVEFISGRRLLNKAKLDFWVGLSIPTAMAAVTIP